jgi:putative tryptophan/tyrosine transport system substrate-binding protein
MTVDRRRFLVTSLAGTLGAPLAARAQQTGKVYRIGFLSPNSPAATAPYSEAFRRGLRELGWIEGQNIVIEYRFAEGKFAQLPDLAGQFVAAGVDVIVATFNPAIIAAAKATTTIPIVALIVLQPVETGIVKSLARPGGNVTGLSWEDGTEQVTKKLEIFKEIAPTAARMAAVWNPTVPGLARYWEPFKTSATALGMGVSSVEYSSATDLDRAMTTIQRTRPSGVFFWGDPLASVRRQELCEFALKNRLPTLGPGGTYTEAGCLISYAPSTMDQFRRAPIYVDKILKGAKPADLPMEQPTKYELAINAKTAKTLGLTIPPSLRLRADQVIE